MTQSFKHSKRIRIFMNKINPNISRIVIHIDKNIFIPSRTLYLHWTHEIHMKQLDHTRYGKMLHHLMRHLHLFADLAFTTDLSFFNLELRNTHNSLIKNNLPHTSQIQMTKFIVTQLVPFIKCSCFFLLETIHFSRVKLITSS